MYNISRGGTTNAFHHVHRRRYRNRHRIDCPTRNGREVLDMGGFIQKRDVITHPFTIIQAFGLRVFVRCLVAKQGTTFLSILITEQRI